MANFLLFPMFELDEPGKEIADYVEKTKPLFIDGSMMGERRKSAMKIISQGTNIIAVSLDNE